MLTLYCIPTLWVCFRDIIMIFSVLFWTSQFLRFFVMLVSYIMKVMEEYLSCISRLLWNRWGPLLPSGFKIFVSILSGRGFHYCLLHIRPFLLSLLVCCCGFKCFSGWFSSCQFSCVLHCIVRFVRFASFRALWGLNGLVPSQKRAA